MPYLHVEDSSLSPCTCPVLRHPLSRLGHCMELSPSVTCSVHNNQTYCRLDFLASDQTYINRTKVFGLARVSNYSSQACLFGYWVSWQYVTKKWRLIITHHKALCNTTVVCVHFSFAPRDMSDHTCEQAHADRMVKCIRTIRTGLALYCLNSH